MLLKRKIQFRSEIALCQKQLMLDVKAAQCIYCSGLYKFLFLARSSYLSACGVALQDETQQEEIFDNVDPVLAFLNSEQGKGLEVRLKPVFHVSAHGHGWSFYCGHCNRRAFPHLEKQARSRPRLGRFQILSPLPSTVRRRVIHWCHSDDELFCPNGDVPVCGLKTRAVQV